MAKRRTVTAHAWPALKAKVVMVGDTGVGKTSILLRYDGKGFTNVVSATIGANFIVSNQIIDDKRVDLQLWDTAGQERFRSMVPMYLRNAAAAFIVFDMTSRSSFEHLPGWVEEVQRCASEHVQLFVLANKSDLEAERRVSKREAQAFAEERNATYLETSAVNGRGIETAVLTCAQTLLEKSPSTRSLPVYATVDIEPEKTEKSSCAC